MKVQQKPIEKLIEDLKESKNLGQIFLDNADEALFFYSMEGELLYVSPAFQKITGYKIQELYEEGFISYVHPDDQEWIKKLWVGLFKGELFEDVEYRIVKKDGDIRWSLSSWKIVLDNDGRQIGIQGKQQDITDHKITELQLKESEQALRKSEERFRSVVQQQTEMICRFQPDFKLTFINEAYCRYFGKPESDLLGQNFLTLIPEEAWESVQKHFASFTQDQSVQTQEHPVIASDGSQRWQQWSNQVFFDKSGKILEFQAVGRDITERKLAEEALRKARDELEMRVQERTAELHEGNRSWQALLKATGDSVLLLDREGVCLEANEAAAKQFSVDRSSLQGMKLYDLMPREVANNRVNFLKNVIESKKSLRFEDMREGMYFEYSLYPVVDAEKEIEKVVVIASDITERKRAEELIREHQAELAHMERLNTMGEMATGLAHELNQPLTAISTYARVALNMLDSGNQRPEILTEAIKSARDQAQRAGEIIRNLRHFVSKHTSTKTNVNLNTLVEEVVSFTEAETRKRGVEVQLELLEDLPLISVDIVQIEQVLVNLVRNSLEVLENALIKARQIAIRTSLKEEGVVLIEVADTGPGMDVETLNHIFESYVSTKGEKGMGMGLSISRSIIEAHSGRLWAESKPGHGATFYFTLPVDRH